MKQISKKPFFKKHSKEISSLIQRIVKMGHLPVFTNQEMEYQTLTQALPILQDLFGLTIKIVHAETVSSDLDPTNKSRFALPGKPAFYLY
jgi:hypothetical protein